jgi:hypothetical protein
MNSVIVTTEAPRVNTSATINANKKSRNAANPYRQWLDGDRIGKKPRDMTDEELVKFTGAGAVVIIQRLKSLRPYFMELRKRFHNLERGEMVCGFRNWGEYCTKHLGKTKRTLNYMLAGGNKNRAEVLRPQHQLPDGIDVPDSHRRSAPAWKDVEAVLEILADADRILARPLTEALTLELKEVVRSAIQVLTEAMMKLGVERDT